MKGTTKLDVAHGVTEATLADPRLAVSCSTGVRNSHDAAVNEELLQFRY